MIRYTKHQDKDYIVINNSIKINDVLIPIQVQVNISKVKEEHHPKIYRVVSLAFDRIINFDKPKEQPVKKAWYKFW
jgi:hypothetical protein